MAESKNKVIAYSSEGYALVQLLDENGKGTNQVKVVDRNGRTVKQVDGKGNIVDNLITVFANEDGVQKAEGFKNGLAKISYVTPYHGPHGDYGGTLETAYVTRSGYKLDSDYDKTLINLAEQVYQQPEILVRSKLKDLAKQCSHGIYAPSSEDYAKIYKILTDVAQHAFSEKAYEITVTRRSSTSFMNTRIDEYEKQELKDLAELEKLARRVTSHMARQLASMNRGNNRDAIKRRIEALIDPSASALAKGDE